MSPLARLLRLRPGEGSCVSLLALQYFFIVAVTIAGKTTRDTYFLSRFDRSYLPLMFVACAAVVALLSTFYARAAAKLDRSVLTGVTYALFIAVLLAIQTNITGTAIPILYVWVEAVISLATLQFWIQAADSFDPRQAKRLFGLIGGGGSLAAIMTGLALKPYVKAFGSDSLLLLVCAGLAASWLCGRLASRYVIREDRPRVKSSRPAPAVKLDRYLISIALIVGLSAAATQIVDYQFKISAGMAFAQEADLASFFGRFYAAAGAASLLMQLVFTPLILGRFGLRAGLLALPSFLGLSALSFLLWPGLIIASVAKFSDQSFKFTLHNSSLELLWVPVSPDRRKVLKPIVGGTLKASAEAIAGLVTFFAVRQINFRFLSAFVVAAVAVWLVFSIRIAALYIVELGSAIARRQVDMSGLRIDVQDPSFTKTVARELEDSDLLRRLFALELIEGLPLRPWASRLRQMLMEGQPEEQSRILEIASNEEDILPDDLLVALVDQGGPLSAQAIPIAASRSLASSIPSLRRLLESSDELTQVEAASAVRLLCDARDPAALEVLGKLARDGSGRAQAIAVSQLWDQETMLPADTLRALLRSGSPEGRIAACSVVARRIDTGSVPDLLAQLSDARTAPAAVEALQVFPAATIGDCLHGVISLVPASPLRAGVLKALPDLQLPDKALLLAGTLERLERHEARAAALSLLVLARLGALPAEVLPLIDTYARRSIQESYRCVRILRLLGDDPHAALLSDHCRNRIRQAVPAALFLGAVTSPQSPVELFIRVYESADAARLPFLVEFVDSSFRSENRTSLIPLLESTSWAEKDAVGAKLCPDLPHDLESALRELVASADGWESTISRHYVVRAAPHVTVVDLDQNMFSTLEKTILLKSVSLFQDIPAEVLSRVAAIADERTVAMGARVLSEGDAGESLFVLAGGSVKIHRGDKELTTLHRGDCLGEMAVLDSAPRSASATALEESTLLEIHQSGFYQVMESNPEVMHQIVRLLTRRLRDANERIAAAT